MPTINGVAYDGGCVEARFGGSAFEIQEINYEDEVDKKKVRSLGSTGANKRTPGSYEAKDDTVKVDTAVWAQMLAKLPANGYSNYEFPIVIDHVHPDLGVMHVVKERCCIIGVKGAGKEGSEATMVDVKISCMQIKINGKTLNTIRGTATTAAQNAGKF